MKFPFGDFSKFSLRKATIFETPQMTQNIHFFACLGQTGPGAGLLGPVGPDPHQDRAIWTLMNPYPILFFVFLSDFGLSVV